MGIIGKNGRQLMCFPVMQNYVKGLKKNILTFLTLLSTVHAISSTNPTKIHKWIIKLVGVLHIVIPQIDCRLKDGDFSQNTFLLLRIEENLLRGAVCIKRIKLEVKLPGRVNDAGFLCT